MVGRRALGWRGIAFDGRVYLTLECLFRTLVMIEYFELLCNLITPLFDPYFPTQNLGILVFIFGNDRKGEYHFSNTTPNTSSTSPASPRPVIRARQFAAERRCSAASTISLSRPDSDD